ncbi:MAG: response regulator [Deltaproteobacteria bacterium]|jgi:signal transduction histidine kinase/FixJ family two-component response regulator|nr:response regulator [Deltaproteobacteria bacterium]
MSIRVKTIVIIVAIVGVITVASIGISLSFVRKGLEETVEKDISVMVEMAEDLISSEIKLLQARTSTVAVDLLHTPEQEWPQIIREHIRLYENFMALTVFDRNGAIVQSAGRATVPADLADSPYMRRAFAGEMAISTTRQDPTGALVFHICVPMEERALAVTVPGLFLADLLSSFKIWETGSVFILDSEGTVLAHERKFLVLERYNFITVAQRNPEITSLGAFVERMIRGKQGVGRYLLFDEERLCAYTPLTGSNDGWMLGVSVPLSESPVAQVYALLLFTGLGFLGLGTLAAFMASGLIAKPFRIIHEQNIHLTELSRIAQTASDAKTRFLANMSHEMRTPLNAIIGFSDMMILSPAGEEENRANLQKIHTAGVALLGIVNDILDISRIESGKLELVPAEYGIASFINDTISVNRIRIRQKPIQFVLRLDPAIPCRMIGDELRVKQICNNLLSNACKYTLEGQVTMRVSGAVEGESVWLTVSVQDTGIGIRAEDLPKLFSDYSQINAKSNRAIEGTGLGLSIARELAKLMDGEITVESEYGKGSVFTARIRQQCATNVPIGEDIVENLEKFHYLDQAYTQTAGRVILRLPYARVLVVDDIPANLEVARGMLKPYGIRVDCVAGGQQAIELVREEKIRYNAIFMDHMMPGMDGIEAVRVIREEIGTPYARSVPIIAMTANAIVGSEQMFLQHGFQAFISKPVSIMRLDLVLTQWVRDRNLEQDCERVQADPIAETDPAQWLAARPPIDGLDLAACLERFSGNARAMLKALRSYALTTPALLEQVREPTAQTLPQYTITLHGLKSSSYGICAAVAGNRAEKLELAAKSGDTAFIAMHNGMFLETVATLIARLRDLLRDHDALSGKPEKDEPDAAVLDRLRCACERYDMDGVDKAMGELEAFSYARAAELVAWLRERVDMMDFRQILQRFSTF